MDIADVAERLRPALALHNTLTSRTDHFEPMDGDTVRLYLCGPTVYSTPHIGNMRTYLFSDVLRRTLRLAGYDVQSAMNITDVGHLTSDADAGDDKLEAAARSERLTAWQVAEKYTQVFFDFAERLNILPTTYVLPATDHIKEQVALVERLDAKGVVYRTDDGMYMDSSEVPDYGKLTPNDTRTQLRAGERVALGEKRHATDFAVWKFSPPDGRKRDMEWPSPWGVGFPSWHIECSAMAMAYLGDTLDIHVGGIDHIAVHHTNEIAQSETATGKPFSRWWMHGAFLTLDAEKRMGKSQGNSITLDTLAERGYHPLDLRYLTLLGHYRSPVSFSWDALDSAASARQRLQHRVDLLTEEAVEHPADPAAAGRYVEEFVTALADDIAVPRAVAVTWNMLRDQDTPPAAKLAALRLFDEIFGLDLIGTEAPAELPAEIIDLAGRRWNLRKERRFAEADELREQLLEAGYAIEDRQDDYGITPTGR